MKKRYLLLPLVCGLIYITTTSELPGSSLGSSVASCGQGGCHTGGTGSTTSTTGLTLTDQANSQVVSGSYTPGHIYTVKLTGSNTANLPKFGFQLKASKGVYSSPATGETIVASTMLTHGSTALAAVSNVYTATATWTAPAAGSGTVTFTGIFNAVNGNNLQTGDMPGTPQPFTYTEAVAATAVSNVSLGSLSVYPNPASNMLNLRLSNAASGRYELMVYNTAGVRVLSRTDYVSQGNQVLSLDITHLAAGTYFIAVGSNESRLMKTFLKQ